MNRAARSDGHAALRQLLERGVVVAHADDDDVARCDERAEAFGVGDHGIAQRAGDGKVLAGCGTFVLAAAEVTEVRVPVDEHEPGTASLKR